MTDIVSFQARARTIDHLGREQIADCPTAISELWKNAYDAYARSVSLHIFDDQPVPVAAIFDDGHGMNRQEFVERWLVIGTEAKLRETEAPDADRDNLPKRERQGEKGIGRLSVAHLGPLVLVLSKRQNAPLIAALVDWRLFQNPYLMLSDIGIPVEEISNITELPTRLSRMFDVLADNVFPKFGTPERNNRIELAWQILSEQEKKKHAYTTENQIIQAATDAVLTARHLEQWSVWTGDSTKGTALFIFGINRELSVWTELKDTKDDPEANDIKALFYQTLRGFTDPYSRESVDFSYKAVAHIGSLAKVFLSAEESFGIEDLRSLEHVVEGSVDSNCIFRGRIRAFGNDLGMVTLSPQRLPPLRSIETVGPFDICIGTFEQVANSSTHPPDIHRDLSDKSERFGGFSIYRDGLRVMPYGRPNSDFFEIDERRSRHAGREFWAHRRSFGRVAITRQANPNLRDKAGREGLIDNRARRELKILVMDILMQLARRYFGTSAPLREQRILEIERSNKAAQEAESRIRQRHFSAFRDALRAQSTPLDEALADVRSISQELGGILAKKATTQLPLLADKVESISKRKSELTLPPRPNSLRTLEEKYRDYRDRYQIFCGAVDALSRQWALALERLQPTSRDEAARSELGRHQKFINDELGRRHREILKLLSSEVEKWKANLNDDRGRYYASAGPLLGELANGQITLERVLNLLESIRESLFIELASRYDSYIRALQQLTEGIDIDAAVVWSSGEREKLARKVDQLHDLAQLGIAVEIIGHELDSLDAQITQNLNRLPSHVRELEPWKLVKESYESLITRLRFLSPMLLAGPRLKKRITGKQIFQYLSEFFALNLSNARIRLDSTKAFCDFEINELPSRIFPVFVNLVGNSIYWLSFAAEREILLDVRDNEVIVSDSGKGIDPDDVDRLFDLFFSRRINGRGVGLYLCRTSLAAGGHTIEYLVDEHRRILAGANFAIRFKGTHHVAN